MTTKAIQFIIVLGRRWFHRGPGNTYHSAAIYVDGELVHKIEFAYGYGDQYLWHAFEWLEKNGYVKAERYTNGNCESPWRTAERVGFKLSYEATDVQRKKDL